MIKPALEALKRRGYTPRTMLDIGAHIGTFTQEFLGVYPACVPTLVEPNPFCLTDLAKLGFEQHGVAASNEAGKAELFLSREWLQSTGTSLYRENTQFFRDEVVVKREVEKVRLDDLFAGRRFDFVKIDTQGSELDVLNGGGTVLAQADYIMLEISMVEYNIGGARAEDLFARLDALGFRCAEVTDFHRLKGVHNGNLLQMDFLFERRGLASRAPDAAALDDLRSLAHRLHAQGRAEDALMLLNHVQSLAPDDIETLKDRITVMGAAGRTLEALHALADLKAHSGDVEELIAEIQSQMPATLERFNRHIAAGEVAEAEPYIAALANLLPGNRAVLDSAMTCNLALGRSGPAQKYAAALQAIPATQHAAPTDISHPRKQRARKRA
jgi:FkbM family methyltransferase